MSEGEAITLVGVIFVLLILGWGPTYMTFGQIHAHRIGKVTVDANCVAVFPCEEEVARQYARDHLKNEYMSTYTEDTFDVCDLRYYPRGLVEVEIDLPIEEEKA